MNVWNTLRFVVVVATVLILGVVIVVKRNVIVVMKRAEMVIVQVRLTVNTSASSTNSLIPIFGRQKVKYYIA